MVETISPSKACELLALPNAQLIDVRDSDEWVGGHIEGARWLPLDQLRADPEHELPADSVLIFVCAKGQRSLTAAKLAERFGFAASYSIAGGTKAWAQAGYPLVAERVAA